MVETEFDFPMEDVESSPSQSLAEAKAVTVMGKGEDARPTIEYYHKKLWVKAPDDARYPGADIWLMPDGSRWVEEALEPGHEVRRFHRLE
jgi:hypothetical protein